MVQIDGGGGSDSGSVDTDTDDMAAADADAETVDGAIDVGEVVDGRAAPTSDGAATGTGTGQGRETDTAGEETTPMPDSGPQPARGTGPQPNGQQQPTDTTETDSEPAASDDTTTGTDTSGAGAGPTDGTETVEVPQFEQGADGQPQPTGETRTVVRDTETGRVLGTPDQVQARREQQRGAVAEQFESQLEEQTGQEFDLTADDVVLRGGEYVLAGSARAAVSRAAARSAGVDLSARADRAESGARIEGRGPAVESGGVAVNVDVIQGRTRSAPSQVEVRDALEGIGVFDEVAERRQRRLEEIEDEFEQQVGAARAEARGITNPRLREAAIEQTDIDRDEFQVTQTASGAEVTLAPDFQQELQQELEDIAGGRITASLSAQTGADLERGEGVEIVERDGVLFAELTRQGRKQISIERSELVGPTEGTPFEDIARAGAGAGFEFQEFRRQRRESFFESIDEGVAEGMEALAGIQVRLEPDDEFTTLGAITGDFGDALEEQFGSLGPVQVRGGPQGEFITIEELAGGAAQAGASAFDRAFPDVNDSLVQDPITAADTVADDFADAADAAFPGAEHALVTAPFQAGADIFEEFGPPAGRAIDRAFPDADDPLIQDPIEAGEMLASDAEEFLTNIDTQQTGTRLVAAGALGFAGPQLVEPTSTAVGAGAVLAGGALLAGGAVLAAGERLTRPDDFEAPTVSRVRPEFDAPLRTVPGGLPGDIAQPEEQEPFLGPEIEELPESLFVTELDVPLGRPTLQEVPVGEKLLPQPLTLELPEDTGESALGQAEVPIDIEDGEVEVGPAGAMPAGETVQRERPQPSVPADPMGETVVGGDALEEATRRIERARQREEQRGRRQLGVEAGEGVVQRRTEEELLEEARQRQEAAAESVTQPAPGQAPLPGVGQAADQVSQQFEQLAQRPTVDQVTGTRFFPATTTMQVERPAMDFNFPAQPAQRFETRFPNLEAQRFETVFEFAPVDVGFDTPRTRLRLPDLPETEPRKDDKRGGFGLFGRRTEVLPGDPDAVLDDFEQADSDLDDLLREL